MEHKLILGGEQYLPFARSRIKALRATGLTYASQQFEVDGNTIAVRIAGDQEFIRLDGGQFMALSVGREGIFNPGAGPIIPASGAIEGPPPPGVLRQAEKTLLSPDGARAVRFAARTLSFLKPDPDNPAVPTVIDTQAVPFGYLGQTSAYLGVTAGRMTPAFFGEKISGPDPTDSASTETMVGKNTIVWVNLAGAIQRRFFEDSGVVKYGVLGLSGTKDCVYALIRKQTFTEPPPFFSAIVFPHLVEITLHAYGPSGDQTTVIDSSAYPSDALGGSIILTSSGGADVLVNRYQDGYTSALATAERTTTLYRKIDGVYTPTVLHRVTSAGVATGVFTPESNSNIYMAAPPPGLTSGRFTYFVGGTLLIRYPAVLGGAEQFVRRLAVSDPAIAGSFSIQGKTILSSDLTPYYGTRHTLKIVEVSSNYADSAATHIDYVAQYDSPPGSAVVDPRFGLH
jgi:hypothetical protein